MATPLDGPSNGMSQAMLRRQPVGRAHRGALRAQDVDGAADRAVVQRRMGGARDQDKDVFHAPPLAAARWICKQSARHGPERVIVITGPTASGKSALALALAAAAAGHGDQCRRHADLRCLPDPDRAAHGARNAPACRIGSMACCRCRRPCRPRAGGRWQRPRSSAAWPRAARPSCAAARASICGP